MTLAVSIAQSGANNVTMRNRIINGAMVIDQRNAGASVTAPVGANSWATDRFALQATQTSKFTGQQNAGSVTPPAGFKNYLGLTSSSAYSVISSDFFLCTQWIEGYNAADLGWGAAGASTVTLSFWARSSLTGTFAGSINNADYTRSYPFTYTISSANTWEYKTITIAGDTAGTWGTTNGRGIGVQFNMGAGSSLQGTANAWNAGFFVGVSGQQQVVGTNGATFYVTGVQLEAGSTATAFEYRSYGAELYLCQRYFWPYIFGDSAGQTPGPVGWGESTTQILAPVQYPQTMRANPSISTTNTAGEFRVRYAGAATPCTSVPYGVNINTMACWLFGTVASGITLNGIYALSGNNSNVKLNFSAEL